MCLTRIAIVLVSLVTAGGQAIAAGGPSAHAISGPDFGQCRVQHACPGQAPCVDDDFEDEADLACSASCYDQNPNCLQCVNQSVAFQGLSIQIDSGYFDPAVGGEGGATVAAVILEATPVGPILELFGRTVFTDPTVEGLIQVAALHFDGNPNLLRGLVANSVASLIAQGVITQQDVLWTETYTEEAIIDVDVPLSGTPPTEVVLFGSLIGPRPPANEECAAVPATSEFTIILTALVLLVLGGFAVRRRQEPA